MLMNGAPLLVIHSPREENRQCIGRLVMGKVVYYVELCAFMGPIKKMQRINWVSNGE